MECIVLEFPEVPKPVPCGHCEKKLRPRSARNSPAFCCYTCGVIGQPHAVKQTIKNLTGSQG